MKYDNYCNGSYINGPCYYKNVCFNPYNRIYDPGFYPPICPCEPNRPICPCEPNRPICPCNNNLVCIDPMWIFIGGILLGSNCNKH